MAGDDVILRFRINVGSIEAEVEIVAQTAQTVLVKIDPTKPWDSRGLRYLSAALEIVAKTLPFAEYSDK